MTKYYSFSRYRNYKKNVIRKQMKIENNSFEPEIPDTIKSGIHTHMLRLIYLFVTGSKIPVAKGFIFVYEFFSWWCIVFYMNICPSQNNSGFSAKNS